MVIPVKANESIAPAASASILMVAAGASHGRLFRQGELAIDIEVAADRRCSGVWLAATNADRVVTSGNDRVAILSDHDQIAVLQVEVDLLARARFQMNFLESAESDFVAHPSHRGT